MVQGSLALCFLKGTAMASAATLTAYDAVLKDHYTQDRVEDMVYQDNPLFALLPKMERFGGRKLPIPILYGNPQGRSRTFSNAQTRGAASSSSTEAFDLTRVKDYGVVTIDNEALEASKNDVDSFLEIHMTEIDGIINELARNHGRSVYRGVDGSIGQVSAEPTENAGDFTITMKVTSDVNNIEVGQMIVIHSAKSGGSQRTSDGSDNEWVVEAVDRDAGTFTLTGTYDSSGTIAADDYIFVEGDRGASISGLEDWLPSSAPGATAFFGVDRSVDPVRLGGMRLDGTGGPIEEVLTEADAKAGNHGQKLTHFFMSHTKFGELKNSLGSKVQYVDMQANARVSFRGIMVDGQKGPIRVVPDHNCPDNRIFGLNLPMWKFYSLGKAVRVLNSDGLEMLRQASDDGVECRYGFYGNLGCRAPGSSMNIQV